MIIGTNVQPGKSMKKISYYVINYIVFKKEILPYVCINLFALIYKKAFKSCFFLKSIRKTVNTAHSMRLQFNQARIFQSQKKTSYPFLFKHQFYLFDMININEIDRKLCNLLYSVACATKWHAFVLFNL